MKVLIIEDEPLVAKEMQRLLTMVEPEAEVENVLTSVATALTWFRNNPLPNLIFSDVRLSDGVSFEIYESLEITCPLIFTTAYDEYAIRAFKLNSIDYLLKPVDEKELRAAIHKYKTHAVENSLQTQLQGLLQQWQEPSRRRYKERFLTLHRNALVPINESDIAYFHKEELIHLHTITGEKYISDHQTVDELEGLVDPEKFFRVNRQYLVHRQVVARIRTTHKGLTVELKGAPGVEIDISREKATAFKAWLA